jgi:hypothetical protein
MTEGVDVARLQELEQRLSVLEAKSGQARSDGGQQSEQLGGKGMNGGQGQQPSSEALVQAFMQGTIAGQALAHAQAQAAQAAQQGQGATAGQTFAAAQGGAAPQFAPTSYDSVFWCRSRAMCNPLSISCFC